MTIWFGADRPGPRRARRFPRRPAGARALLQEAEQVGGGREAVGLLRRLRAHAVLDRAFGDPEGAGLLREHVVGGVAVLGQVEAALAGLLVVDLGDRDAGDPDVRGLGAGAF